MAPGTHAAEHGGEEQALVDFEPALVALEQAVFGRDILRRGNEARHDVGGADRQLFDPNEGGALLRQRIVDRIGVAAEKTHPRVAGSLLNELRRGVLARAAARLLRQPSEKTRRSRPIFREFRPVGGKLDGLTGFRLQPGLDVVRGQTRPPYTVGYVVLRLHSTDASQTTPQ